MLKKSISILEGAKASQKLISQAMKNPDMTLGFEAEFFVRGAGNYLKSHHNRNSKTDIEEDWVTKRLDKATWEDIIKYFYPIGAGSRFEGNDEIIVERVKELYGKAGFNKSAKPRDMFKELKNKYKMYHILTLLRIFPHEKFHTSLENNIKTRNIIEKGNLYAATSKIKNLDEAEFRMYQPGAELVHFNVNEPGSRASFYELLAEFLEEYVGGEVVASSDADKIGQKTLNYTKWMVTSEDSLADGEDGYEYVGVEVISPVMNIKEGLKSLSEFLGLMNNFSSRVGKGLSLETTRATGLHVNIGYAGKEIDYMKLLFLMGDDYVSKEFGRHGGSHSQSVLNVLLSGQRTDNQHIAGILEDPPALIRLGNLMQQSYALTRNEMSKVMELIKSFIPWDKFFSFNFSKLDQGYVEFRSIGNKDYQKRASFIDDIVKRLAVMVFVSTNPEIYKKEYLGKLYTFIVKLLTKYAKDMKQQSMVRI